ncbi:MAG TPA: hypothetical protein VGS20_12130 [Candidatus Acidoferrales bacterium]|nr:hypothetical protein [Candidatus Acidoferrales bacterium]
MFAITSPENMLVGLGRSPASVESERQISKQRLPGPAGRQVNADRPGGLPDASADLEQASAQRLDLRRSRRAGLRELEQAEQVDQVVGEAVQERPEGVGQETVTAQPVGAEAVLQLLGAVLAFAAVIVNSEDLGGAAGTVRNREAEVPAGGGVLGLVGDAALTRPTAGAVAEA